MSIIASVVVYESEKSEKLLDFQAASFNNHMRQVLLQYQRVEIDSSSILAIVIEN